MNELSELLVSRNVGPWCSALDCWPVQRGAHLPVTLMQKSGTGNWWDGFPHVHKSIIAKLLLIFLKCKQLFLKQQIVFDFWGPAKSHIRPSAQLSACHWQMSFKQHNAQRIEILWRCFFFLCITLIFRSIVLTSNRPSAYFMSACRLIHTHTQDISR